jgi:hypothetical protein
MLSKSRIGPDGVRTTSASSLTVNVRMPDGGLLSPPVQSGMRIVDALAAFGLPMRRCAEGGPCASRVDPAWVARLQPADHIERSILTALGADDGVTRLLGHLIMTPELNGLALELSWDVLVPQTYWVAG